MSRTVYCPCNGKCHIETAPCSFDCLSHHTEVKHRPTRALPSDGACVCLRSDDDPMHVGPGGDAMTWTPGRVSRDD